jgi:hypothetical protein
MQLCLKLVSGWRGAGCCWGTWMMSDHIKVSKGLEFPVVALPGVGHMPPKGEDKKEASRVFYVAATRATQRLVIGVGGDGGRRLNIACCSLSSNAQPAAPRKIPANEHSPKFANAINLILNGPSNI